MKYFFSFREKFSNYSSDILFCFPEWLLPFLAIRVEGEEAEMLTGMSVGCAAERLRLCPTRSSHGLCVSRKSWGTAGEELDRAQWEDGRCWHNQEQGNRSPSAHSVTMTSNN